MWKRVADGSTSWILPDGCIDVLWNGRDLTIAGPDTTAHLASAPTGTRYTALRFASGVAPIVLGVAADGLRDQCPGLADVIGAADTDRLSEALLATDHPSTELERWADRRLAQAGGRDRTMGRVAALIGQGRTVAEVAAEVGFSERQLNRRSRTSFGYGPKVLARVLTPAARPELGSLWDVAGSCRARRRLRRSGPLRPRGARTHRSIGISARRERSEQVDAVAVRVAQRRVALPPERIPGFEVAIESGAGHCRIGGVHFGGISALEGQRGSRRAGTRGSPLGIERLDRRYGVEQETKPTGECHLDVWLRVRVGGNVEAERAIEGQGAGQVRRDQADG